MNRADLKKLDYKLSFFKPLIDEAREFAPGYIDLVALNYYWGALVRTINHSTNQTIIDKAKIKAAKLKILISLLNEGRN